MRLDPQQLTLAIRLISGRTLPEWMATPLAETTALLDQARLAHLAGDLAKAEQLRDQAEIIARAVERGHQTGTNQPVFLPEKPQSNPSKATHAKPE